MSYTDIILMLAKDNKYTKWYISICSNAQFRASTRKAAISKLGNVECHHILPKCFNMGGLIDKANYAFLTPKEHFTCHRLLTKMFSTELHAKMVFAINMFTRKSKRHNFIKITARVYEQIKTELRIVQLGRPAPNRGIPMSEEQKKKLRGIPKSEETKAKISASKLGKTMSLEFKNRMSEIKSGDRNPFFGRKHTDKTKARLSDIKTGITLPPRTIEHRNALSKANTGKVMSQEKRELMKQFSFKSGAAHPFAGGLPEYMKITCIHCGKTTSKGLHTRWHGSKCKHAPIN